MNTLADWLDQNQGLALGAGVAILFLAFGLAAGPAVQRSERKRARRKGQRYRDRSPIRRGLARAL